MISIIAAIDKNYLIGNGNELPWPNLPADMAFFKKKTEGGVVIMGRKTFETLPEIFRPLPNRKNIVLSKKDNIKYVRKCCLWQDSLLPKDIKDIVNMIKNGKDEYFVIGGAEIYKLFLKNGWVDKIYLTRIDGKFEGDVYFPEKYLENKNYRTISWQNVDEKNPYGLHFVEYFMK